jgi:hypothetical protein
MCDKIQLAVRPNHLLLHRLAFNYAQSYQAFRHSILDKFNCSITVVIEIIAISFFRLIDIIQRQQHCNDQIMFNPTIAKCCLVLL